MTTRDPVCTLVNCISFTASPLSHIGNISDAVSSLTAADNDVVVISSSGESVPANRSLLCLASPLLRDLLSSVSCCTSPTILLPDFSTHVLKHLVSIVSNGFTTTHLGNGVFKEINEVMDTAKLLVINIADLSYERSFTEFENEGTIDDQHDSTSYADKQIYIKVELFDDLDHDMPVIESCKSLVTEKEFINDRQIIELSEGDLMRQSFSHLPKVREPALVTSAASLTNNEQLEKSDMIQSPQDVFPCEECGKTFKSLSKLKGHKTRHSSIPLPNLKEIFKSSSKEASKDKIKCKNCRKIFNCKDSLDEHVKNGCEKPHQCPYCPTKFFHIQNVKRHVRIKHANETVPSFYEKSHQCSYCPAKFLHAHNIKRHVQMKHPNESNTFPDTEEMSHQCPYCPTKFFHAKSIQRHVKHKHSMRNVTDTKDSQVVVKEKERLNNSLLLHKCSYCSKVFLKEKLMKIHKKKCQVRLEEETDDEQKQEDPQNSTNKTVDSTSKLSDAACHGPKFKCKDCPEEFKTKEDWDWHMDIYHGTSDVE